MAADMEHADGSALQLLASGKTTSSVGGQICRTCIGMTNPTSMSSVLTADSSGTKSMRRSRSSSCRMAAFRLSHGLALSKCSSDLPSATAAGQKDGNCSILHAMEACIIFATFADCGRALAEALLTVGATSRDETGCTTA